MRKIILTLVFAMITSLNYAQVDGGSTAAIDDDVTASKTLTKEQICKGAAVSVVANVAPWVKNKTPKTKVVEVTKSLVKDAIKESPSKAFDLLTSGKSKDETIDVLYKDFMKLDSSIITKGLLSPENDGDQ